MRLVTFSQKHQFSQTTHSKHFTKQPLGQPEAPDTKTPQKRAWWAGFRPHQVRKQAKSAPGRQVYVQSRRKITGLSSKTALYEDELTKNASSSKKTAPNVDVGHRKIFLGRWLKEKLGKFPCFPLLCAQETRITIRMEH